MIDLLILSTLLDPKDSFKSFDIDKICNLANKYYTEDFSDQKKLQLWYELQHFHFDVCQHMQFEKPSTLALLCQKLTKTGKSTKFPLVNRLIRLVLTTLVSTATCERAFSAMNIVKTKLKTKIEDDFIRDVVVISIERELVDTLCIDSIIDDFVLMKSQRVRFI